jgi:biopolymer transport protein ExbB/TolQ
LAKVVLILFSVASVAVMIERAITLVRVRRREEREYASLTRAIAARDEAAFRSLVESVRSPSGAALREGLDSQPTSEERLREAVGYGVTLQTARLQNNLSYLATIASTAPYIGLFGTVLGILSAFRRIAASGETGASIVAGGISEALITTAIGLGVAIPAVIAYNFLLGRVNALALTVETHAMALAARMADLRVAQGKF